MADVRIKRLNIILPCVDIAAQQRHGRIRALGQLQHRRDARRDDGQALDVLEHGRQHIARLARAEEHGLPCEAAASCAMRYFSSSV